MKFSLIFLNFVALMALVACAGNLQKNHKPVTLVTKGKDTELLALADQAANLYGVNRQLFRALVKQESAWDPYALSSKGARGLTQIMPRTGRTECGLEKEALFNPRLNLYCGAYYFSKLLRRFGNVELALAAYNSGETRVARLGRIPRIRETQRYVKRIMASWQSSHFRRW
jgi:soluble lytic murein transglycosylase-like protein